MWWSEQTFRVFGLDPESTEPSHTNFWEAIHPEDRELVRARIGEALDVSKSFSVEHRIAPGREDVRYVHQEGELVESDNGEGAWICGTIWDVTDERHAQEEIRRLASYDSLTGLANRRLFQARLDQAIEQAVLDDSRIGLLYIDLDGFKRINDSLGHMAGDELLRRVADLLRANVRGCDVVGRVDRREYTPSVSRLGGDEFTILLTKMDTTEEAADVAKRILRALSQPMKIAGREVFTTGSIGIAVFPEDGVDRETLVKHADTAMYHAKGLGRNNFQYFSSAMNVNSLRKLTLEGRMRRAVDQNEFQLYYQPKLDLQGDKVVGGEALLRWETEDLGTISPKELIPIAEETGLICSLGAWVLENACAQIREWQLAGYTPLPVGVNVSARQFMHDDLVSVVSEALRTTGLSPRLLDIEITESTLLQDNESTALMLRDLRAIGVRVTLDDFGTGYSSLSYLSRFPLDALKLDRAFVRDIDTDPSALAVARAVIDIAHSLDLVVVAEGVDSDSQLRLLRESGCDQIQGFLFSAAVAAEEFVSFLKPAPGREQPVR